MNIDTSPEAVAALVDELGSCCQRNDPCACLTCVSMRTLEALVKERDEKERTIRWFNDRVLGDGVIIDDMRARLDLLQHVNARLCSVLSAAGAPSDPQGAHEMQAWAASVTAAQAREARLRWLLALTYAGVSLYADDGEMQDSTAHPFIDFKRDTPEEIERKLIERNRAAIDAARTETKGTQ